MIPQMAGGIGLEPTSTSLTVRCLTVRPRSNKIGSPAGISTPISPFVAVCRVHWTTGPNRALPLSYASSSGMTRSRRVRFTTWRRWESNPQLGLRGCVLPLDDRPSKEEQVGFGPTSQPYSMPLTTAAKSNLDLPTNQFEQADEAPDDRGHARADHAKETEYGFEHCSLTNLVGRPGFEPGFPA